MNTEAFLGVMTRANSPDYTVATLSQANHLFQEVVSGSPSEYTVLEPEFVPGKLKSVREWTSQ